MYTLKNININNICMQCVNLTQQLRRTGKPVGKFSINNEPENMYKQYFGDKIK